MKRDIRVLQSCCDIRGGCWVWRLGGDAKGRPVARIDGKSRYVRRVVYELHNGVTLPDGQIIGARCGNMRCISPTCSFIADNKAIQRIAADHGRHNHYGKQLAIRVGKARASSYPPEVIKKIRAMPTSRAAVEATGVSKSWANRIRGGMARTTEVDIG